MLVQVFIGIILALSLARPLDDFGQLERVADVVALAMFREMGALISGVVLSGFAGASIAAELGAMVEGEEIKALRAHALDPIRFLVVPRVLATTVMMVGLTVLANVVGVCGGLLIGVLVLGISPVTYIDLTREALTLTDYFTGLLKAGVFGAIIAGLACYEGLHVRGGAEGVGRDHHHGGQEHRLPDRRRLRLCGGFLPARAVVRGESGMADRQSPTPFPVHLVRVPRETVALETALRLLCGRGRRLVRLSRCLGGFLSELLGLLRAGIGQHLAVLDEHFLAGLFRSTDGVPEQQGAAEGGCGQDERPARHDRNCPVKCAGRRARTTAGTAAAPASRSEHDSRLARSAERCVEVQTWGGAVAGQRSAP